MLGFSSPSSRAHTTNALLRGLNTLFNGKGVSDLAKVLLTLRLEKIGRANAGKSAIEWALAKVVVSNFFMSGLQLDVENPLQVAELIEKDKAIRARLENDPLLPTTEATPIKYLLYEGEKPRLCLASHEVIGQILLNCKSNSPPEWKAKYQEYMERLPKAQILWAMIPVPPARSSAGDQARFEIDLKLTVSYLREALKLRASDVPMVVALILTRADSRHTDAEAARRELTDEVVQHMLMPLVTLVRISDKVSEAAVFVTSAYGFGNAVRKPDNLRNGEAASDDQDGQWTLNGSDAHVTPFNLSPLVVWTLYHGLFEQKVEKGTPEARTLGHVLELLKYDLDNCGGWIVPIKTRHELSNS